jgi:hypothetical protein
LEASKLKPKHQPLRALPNEARATSERIRLALAASYILMVFFPSISAKILMRAGVTDVTFSIGIGLIFGVWPARKASRLDPKTSKAQH